MTLRQICIAGAMALGWVTAAEAQSGPSYEDTVAFIEGKIEVSGSRWQTNLTFPKQCLFVMTERRNDNNIRWEHAVDLVNIDPSKVEWYRYSTNPNDGYLTMGTRENKRVVRARAWSAAKGYPCHDVIPMDRNQVKRLGNECYGERADDTITLGAVAAPKSENGPRLQRAFAHLIALCGGKEELF